MPQSLPRHPDVALVQLPPLRARDASFALIDEAGAPIDDRLRQRRRDALLVVFAAARPDAVVLEGFPFARRAFRFELDPLIAAVRAAPPALAGNLLGARHRRHARRSGSGIARSSIASAATSTVSWSMAIPR